MVRKDAVIYKIAPKPKKRKAGHGDKIKPTLEELDQEVTININAISLN